MAPSKTHLETETQLIHELRKLTKEVNKLKNLEFMKVFTHPVKFMAFSFLKGTMVGAGSIIGASLVVAVVAYVLGQISFVPVVGDFVKELLTEMHLEQSGNYQQGPLLQAK